MEQIQARQRYQKDDPSGKLVEKAHRLVGIPVLDAKSGAEDAHCVGRNGNRDAGQ